MSNEPNNLNKLAFSTRCLPGSLAEQKEKERLEEFQRCKAQREAEERRNKPEVDARRNAEYLAASEANQERIRRDKALRSGQRGFLRP